jgi:hypothetical protein
MKTIAIASLLGVLAVAAAFAAPEAPAAPSKEGEWLQQLVGQWEADLEVWPEPGKPPLKFKSTENARRIGKLWVLADSEVVAPGMPFARALTLGYDPQPKKYVGTWVDSNSMHIGTYEGTMDAAGKALTLEGEMPSPFVAGKLVRVREVIELKDRDQKVVTTSLQGADGRWQTLVTVNARRRK